MTPFARGLPLSWGRAASSAAGGRSHGMLLIVAILSLSSVFAQAPKPAKTWTPPKTPWGDPDLQGVWNDATSTPLERPDRVGSKSLLNDEEAGDFQQQLASELSRD